MDFALSEHFEALFAVVHYEKIKAVGRNLFGFAVGFITAKNYAVIVIAPFIIAPGGNVKIAVSCYCVVVKPVASLGTPVEFLVTGHRGRRRKEPHKVGLFLFKRNNEPFVAFRFYTEGCDIGYYALMYILCVFYAVVFIGIF